MVRFNYGTILAYKLVFSIYLWLSDCLGHSSMNFQLDRKQIFMLVLAAVLAMASYFIPLPSESSHSLTKPNPLELQGPATTVRSSSFALLKG